MFYLVMNVTLNLVFHKSLEIWSLLLPRKNWDSIYLHHSFHSENLVSLFCFRGGGISFASSPPKTRETDLP